MKQLSANDVAKKHGYMFPGVHWFFSKLRE